MIQRIQSVFLLLVGICMILFLFLPLWTEINADQTQQLVLKSYRLEQVNLPYNAEVGPAQTVSTWYLAVMAGVAAIVGFTSVFSYKNRLTQMKLGALNALIMAGTLGLSYYRITTYEAVLNPGAKGAFLLGFFMPAAALIFNSLANRFIKRDESLVRSVDRIR